MIHRKNTPWRRAAFVGLALLIGSSPEIVCGSSDPLPGQQTPGEASLPFPHGFIERMNTTSPPLQESADAVLIRKKEWQWHGYLKHALHLPDWIDLGLEHRTRFEVYDHPWRSIQPLGRTDPQIQQRSRVRLGLNGGTFRFLIEGQDSRVHLDDPGDFVTTGVRNEWDILQVFISATLKNVLGTGLRTDLHVGRLTMDFGRRRLIARNDFGIPRTRSMGYIGNWPEAKSGEFARFWSNR